MRLFTIHSFNSEGALKSKTPFAHEDTKTRTVDGMVGNPDCNQGGAVILVRKRHDSESLGCPEQAHQHNGRNTSCDICRAKRMDGI